MRVEDQVIHGDTPLGETRSPPAFARLARSPRSTSTRRSARAPSSAAAATATSIARMIRRHSSRGCRRCSSQSRRTLAATGSLFVHLDYRAVHYVKVALDQLFGRGQFVNEIVWCYAVGGKGRRGFGRKHDTILWYARGPSWAFYPEAVRVPRRGGSHMRVVDGVQEKTDRKTGRVYRYPVSGRQGARGLVDRRRDAQPFRCRAHGMAVAEAGTADRARAPGGDAAGRSRGRLVCRARGRPPQWPNGSDGGSSSSIARPAAVACHESGLARKRSPSNTGMVRVRI